jgi:hypothetical protein
VGRLLSVPLEERGPVGGDTLAASHGVEEMALPQLVPGGQLETTGLVQEDDPVELLGIDGAAVEDRPGEAGRRDVVADFRPGEVEGPALVELHARTGLWPTVMGHGDIDDPGEGELQAPQVGGTAMGDERGRLGRQDGGYRSRLPRPRCTADQIGRRTFGDEATRCRFPVDRVIAGNLSYLGPRHDPVLLPRSLVVELHERLHWPSLRTGVEIPRITRKNRVSSGKGGGSRPGG